MSSGEPLEGVTPDTDVRSFKSLHPRVRGVRNRTLFSGQSQRLFVAVGLFRPERKNFKLRFLF